VFPQKTYLIFFLNVQDCRGVVGRDKILRDPRIVECRFESMSVPIERRDFLINGGRALPGNNRGLGGTRRASGGSTVGGTGRGVGFLTGSIPGVFGIPLG